MAVLLAGIVNEALEAYSGAYGVPESHMHSHTMNSKMAMDDHAMSDSHGAHSLAQ